MNNFVIKKSDVSKLVLKFVAIPLAWVNKQLGFVVKKIMKWHLDNLLANIDND